MRPGQAPATCRVGFGLFLNNVRTTRNVRGGHDPYPCLQPPIFVSYETLALQYWKTMGIS